MAGKSGGKGQKIGRNKRAPNAAAQKQRSERNKMRRMKKHAAAVADKAANPPRVAHGTARRLRRVGIKRKQTSSASAAAPS